MTRRVSAPWVPYVLGIIATLIAAASFRTPPPPDVLHTTPDIIIVMIGLVTFIVTVEVPLQDGTISLGYAAALLVYLCLGQINYNNEALIVMIIGGAAGGLLRAFWLNRDPSTVRQTVRRLIELPLISASQLVISMTIGNFFYYHMDGNLPLTALRPVDILPLGFLVSISVTTYLALYWSVLKARGQDATHIIRQNSLLIIGSLGVPIPFVIAAARIYPYSVGGFVLLTIGLLMLAFGATALGKNQLQYRQQLIELQSLSSVSRSMRTYLDLNALLRTIQLQVITLLNIDNFTVALYDPDRNIVTFPLVSLRNWQSSSLPPHELSNDLVDHVIASKAPLMLSDSPVQRARDLNLLPPNENIVSWLGVPLLAPDRAIGCITVSTEDPEQHFNDRDQRILVALATHASIAIENAQLYRQVEARASQISRLNNLAAQLSGSLDPQRVLDVVAQSAMSIAGSSGAAVFLWWDDAHTSLALARSAGLSSDFTADAPQPLATNRSGVNVPQLLAVQNVVMEPQAAAIRDTMLREGIHAWVELPLANGNDQLGVVVAYFKEPRKFSGDELELLRTFANQASLSISNARQHRQTDEALELRLEQLSVLAVINKELSSTLNLNSIFTVVVDRAIEATRSTQGTLLLCEGVALRRVINRGDNADNALEEVLAKDALAARIPINRTIDSISRLAVPLIRENHQYGVMILSNQSSEVYTDENVSFVSQLATQAMIAIDNAQLFESMTESRNRLQVILDSMHEAVILFDIDGRVTLANPRVTALLDLDVEYIVGASSADLLKNEKLRFAEQMGFDQESLLALFETLKLAAWQGGGRLSYRLEEPRVSFLDRTIVSVVGQDNKPIGLLMVFTDATEERQLAQAREDISRMIVHDLRSPLTAINASMKLLGEIATSEDALGRSIRKTTDVSQRALRKLLHLVDSLLDIAKMESGTISLETERVEFRTLAENVRTELSPLADELDITIKIEVAPLLPQLYIDDNKIERVLLNLVDNALKFTPIGGVVEIRARREGSDKVRIEVADTGPGVPDDAKKRIFDRFQQSDQKNAHRRGTGLGLTFCKLTVEAHGGNIWIEDNPGGGSIFAFILPLEVSVPVNQ